MTKPAEVIDVFPEARAGDDIRDTCSRIQEELISPELTLIEAGVISTVVFFGSARFKPDILKGGTAPQREFSGSHYYAQARELSSLISNFCAEKDEKEFVIVTGGGPGIMEAANRGAADRNVRSIGLTIALKNEEPANPYTSTGLRFPFDFFAIRKMHFLSRCTALICFPGGFGTLDELFEALTLMQNNKMPKIPVVLFGREFWQSVINWDKLVECGVISPEDLSLFSFADDSEAAWTTIRRWHGLD